MRKLYLTLLLGLSPVVYAGSSMKYVGDDSKGYRFPSIAGAGINIETLTNEPSEMSSYLYVDDAYNCDESIKVKVGDREIWTKISCYDLGKGLFMYKEDILDRCGLTATSGNHTPFELKYLSNCNDTIIDPLRLDHLLTIDNVLPKAGVSLDLEIIRRNNH